MSGKSPWSVKGVSAEDREAAKIAARKAGMPIGVWLSEQIRHAASDAPVPEEPAGTEPEPARPPENHGMDDHPGTGHPRERYRGGNVDPRFAFGRGQWSVAEEAVDRGMVAEASAGYPWQFRGGHPAPHVAPPMPAPPPPMPANAAYTPPVPQALHPVPAPLPAAATATETAEMSREVESLKSQLRDLTARIDAMEDKTLARFEPVLSKIEALTDEVERLKAQPAALPVDDAAFSTAPIERAVMRLSERLGHVERAVLPGRRGGRGFFARLFRRG